jgi:hypothetical protein
MNDKTKSLIKAQLSLRVNKLYCSHDNNEPCAECMKRIMGNVSGITGDVTGIKASADDIRKVLKTGVKA